MKITDIRVETAIVPVEHQFVWRKGLPGSGTEMDTIRIIVETDEGITGEAQARTVRSCATSSTADSARTWLATIP